MRVSGAQTAQARNARAMFRALKRDIDNIKKDVRVSSAQLDNVTCKLDQVMVLLAQQTRVVTRVVNFGYNMIIVLLLVALMIYFSGNMIVLLLVALMMCFSGKIGFLFVALMIHFLGNGLLAH